MRRREARRGAWPWVYPAVDPPRGWMPPSGWKRWACVQVQQNSLPLLIGQLGRGRDEPLPPLDQHDRIERTLMA